MTLATLQLRGDMHRLFGSDHPPPWVTAWSTWGMLRECDHATVETGRFHFQVMNPHVRVDSSCAIGGSSGYGTPSSIRKGGAPVLCAVEISRRASCCRRGLLSLLGVAAICISGCAVAACKLPLIYSHTESLGLALLLPVAG